MCKSSFAMTMFSTSRFPSKKAPCSSDMHLGIRGRIMFTSIFEIIMYRTLQRLMGQKSSSLEALSRFGIRIMWNSFKPASR